MHTVLLKKKHAEHHRDGFGQGWFGEFIDYAVGVIPILPLGFLYSVEAGIGLAARWSRLRRLRGLLPSATTRTARAVFLDGPALSCAAPSGTYVEE